MLAIDDVVATAGADGRTERVLLSATLAEGSSSECPAFIEGKLGIHGLATI
jgi:hypothetical protein